MTRLTLGFGSVDAAAVLDFISEGPLPRACEAIDGALCVCARLVNCEPDDLPPPKPVARSLFSIVAVRVRSSKNSGVDHETQTGSLMICISLLFCVRSTRIHIHMNRKCA